MPVIHPAFLEMEYCSFGRANELELPLVNVDCKDLEVPYGFTAYLPFVFRLFSLALRRRGAGTAQTHESRVLWNVATTFWARSCAVELLSEVGAQGA